MSYSNGPAGGNNPRDNDPVGAVRLAEPRRRRAGWLIPLLALLGLLLLGLLLWALLHNSSKKTPKAAVAASPTATAITPPTATPSAALTTPAAAPATPTAGAGAGAGAGAAAGAGTLLAGGQKVLPATGPLGTLSRYAGKPVTATGVPVQSVPADEGFWVGSSTKDRVWVQLTGQAGESAYTVKKGDRISFTGGRMVPTTPGFATGAGVTAAEGAGQLTAQRQHISLAKSAVHLRP